MFRVQGFRVSGFGLGTLMRDLLDGILRPLMSEALKQWMC